MRSRRQQKSLPTFFKPKEKECPAVNVQQTVIVNEKDDDVTKCLSGCFSACFGLGKKAAVA
jgi:hypothetical protein